MISCASVFCRAIASRGTRSQWWRSRIVSILEGSEYHSSGVPLEKRLRICYTDWILQTHIPKKNMSIETCIAHAIHKDLDIIEALPEVQDLPVEQLETYVEGY